MNAGSSTCKPPPGDISDTNGSPLQSKAPPG